MGSQLDLLDNLAWAAALGELLEGLDSSWAAEQAVVWAGLAQGRPRIPGKVAFRMGDFLQAERTLRRRAAVLEGAAQSHLEELVDNPQGWKDTCFVVYLPLQRFLPGWMPFQPCGWD